VAGRDLYLSIFGALVIALSGCSSPAEKAAAAARRAAPTAVVMKSETGQAIDENTTPRTKDGYPTFNGPLTAANVQINDQQGADLQKQMTALTTSRNAGTISEAEYQRRVAEMRKLAAEHGTDTLSQIENK
jgi:hypothetical protein